MHTQAHDHRLALSESAGEWKNAAAAPSESGPAAATYICDELMFLFRPENMTKVWIPLVLNKSPSIDSAPTIDDGDDATTGAPII